MEHLPLNEWKFNLCGKNAVGVSTNVLPPKFDAFHESSRRLVDKQALLHDQPDTLKSFDGMNQDKKQLTAVFDQRSV